jgi:periplasmic mercuric ion binding protein
MKKFLLLSFVMVFVSLAAQAQVKPVVTAIIKTPQALCENCKKRIEQYVKPYDGMLEVTVNYRKGETKVKFVTDRINIEEIKAYIANVGYDADDVLAAEDAYKRLPKTCKKTEDGGTHPKLKTTTPPTPPTQ